MQLAVEGRSALLASVLLATACSTPEPPRVTPRSVRVTSVAPGGVGLAVELDVYNPNSFPLLVRTVNGTLEVGNGIEIGRGRADPAGNIPARGSSLVPTQLSLGFTNLPALSQFALSAKPVPYTFRGVATVGGEKLNADVPFSIKGELTREQVLQAGMRGLGPMGLPLP
jgi:LEA14-like dessication related protein